MINETNIQTFSRAWYILKEKKIVLYFYGELNNFENKSNEGVVLLNHPIEFK